MKQIYIATSKIEGKGIRAGENIKTGEIISRVEGPLKFKINKNKRDALMHPNWVGVKNNIWIDPLKPHKFLNHSCNPTAGMRGLTIIAIRDIKEGEEITVDYSIIEGDPRWELKCLCNEKGCRGIIRSIHYLPKKTFFKYLPHIPSHFKKVYEKHVLGLEK